MIQTILNFRVQTKTVLKTAQSQKKLKKAKRLLKKKMKRNQKIRPCKSRK